MKRCLWLLLMLILLTACRLTVVPPTPSAAATTDADGCVRRQPETRLLLNGLHGYCVQYPDAYDVAFINDYQVAFVLGSPVNMGTPRAEIVMRAAEGQTAVSIAADWAARFAAGGIVVKPAAIMIDGVTAVVLDHDQGQAMQRQVFMVQGDRLYLFTFTPALRTLGKPYRQMEELYTTMIHSFHFIQ